MSHMVQLSVGQNANIHDKHTCDINYDYDVVMECRILEEFVSQTGKACATQDNYAEYDMYDMMPCHIMSSADHLWHATCLSVPSGLLLFCEYENQ